MADNSHRNDRLDAILEEMDRVRDEAGWVPDEGGTPRRLLRAPDGLDDGRWHPSRAAISAMVVCALLAAALFGARVLLAPKASGQPTAQGSTSASVAVQTKPSTSVAASSEPSATSSAPSHIRVHVVGAVAHPGVVTVAAGSRVSDVVLAAGGMTRQADTAGINLARTVSDGEQVHVPVPGEKWEPPADAQPADTAGAPSGGGTAATGTAAGTSSSGAAGGLVNLNTADLAGLDALPGVGPVLAQRILSWRTEHGKFSSVEELGEVQGIGEKMLANLKPKVTV